MSISSKCSRCAKNAGECQIRANLDRLVKAAIQSAELTVEENIPRQIDYMIITDISIIPIKCSGFTAKKTTLEQLLDSANVHPNYNSLGAVVPSSG